MFEVEPGNFVLTVRLLTFIIENLLKLVELTILKQPLQKPNRTKENENKSNEMNGI